MKCINHPDREAVAFCSKCGKPLCEECIAYRDEKGHPYCAQCAIEIKASLYKDEKAKEKERGKEKKKNVGFLIFVIIGIVLIVIAGLFYFIGGSTSDNVDVKVIMNDTLEMKNIRLFYIGEAINSYYTKFKKYPETLEQLKGASIDSTIYGRIVDSSVVYSTDDKYGFILEIKADSSILGNIAFVKSGPIPMDFIRNR